MREMTRSGKFCNNSTDTTHKVHKKILFAQTEKLSKQGQLLGTLQYLEVYK